MMSTGSKKRARSSPQPPTNIESMRDQLLHFISRIAQSRIAEPDSSAENSVDDFLVSLGRSVTDALRTLGETAETARTRIRQIRAVLHAAVDARCNELDATIDEAEAGKVAALERELVAIDATLERRRTDTCAIHEAATTLADTDLVDEQAVLLSRLEDLEVQLRALPTGVVEPPHVGLVADEPALLAAIVNFGCVVAAFPVTATDLTLEGVPTRVRPGTMLHMRLCLGPHHAAQSVEELGVSLGRVASTTRVAALFDGLLAQPFATVTSNPAQRCIDVALHTPTSLGDACVAGPTRVFTFSVSVAGQPFGALPVSIPLSLGMLAPLQLAVNVVTSSSPCFSPEGLLFVPAARGPDIQVFDAQGVSLPGIPVASIGFAKTVNWAAYVHGDEPSLLLANFVRASRLACVDPCSHAVRWAIGPDKYVLGECNGVAVLPAQGLVIISEYVYGGDHALLAIRRSDGLRVGYSDSAYVDNYLTADPATGTVFMGRMADDEYTTFDVESFSLSDGGSSLVSNGTVVAAGEENDARPLAVMPPSANKRVSYLLVGVENQPQLRVISLPDHTLVHTHTLVGMGVTGLAADPWGEVLAVCDSVAKTVHILAWPLPGMPPLE